MIDTSTKLNPHSVFTTCDNDSNRPLDCQPTHRLVRIVEKFASFENPQLVNDCAAESAASSASRSAILEEFCFSKDFLFCNSASSS